MKLPVLLHACLVRFEIIDEGGWSREKFIDFEVLRMLISPLPIYILMHTRENSSPESKLLDRWSQ